VDPKLLSRVLGQLAISPVPVTAAGLERTIESPKETLRAALEELAARGEAVRLGAGRFRTTMPAADQESPRLPGRMLRRRPLANAYTH